MKHSIWLTTLGVGCIALLGACATEPVTQPQVIYAQPTFDKLGNPSCRPGNVPVGDLYPADLPLCSVMNGGAVVLMPEVRDDTGTDAGTGTDMGTVPDIPDDDPSGGNQNRNQTQNQNNNQNRNQNNQQSGGN